MTKTIEPAKNTKKEKRAQPPPLQHISKSI